MSSQDDASVTSVAGPSIVRERMPDIERGMVLAGRYQVEAIIGKGGSGIVLRAFDRTAQMVVAVKVLKQELVHDERWSKRFSRELRLGRPIRHPNVCRIFDIGEGDGYRFLTMELATEGTLRDLIKRNEPLRPLPVRMSDAEAAIAGLAAIHEAGIVHRDVKPDNMLRMGDGRLVISDFGLATDLPTATAVTVMVGTPHYMAPEVRGGEPATTRSDVWSLGVALYEIFFGRRPERRSSFSSEGMSKPPAPLTSTPIERAMLALAERCLSENPMERPADATAVLRLFKNAQASPRGFVRRKRMALVVVGVAVMAIAGTAAKGIHRLRATPIAHSTIAAIEPTGVPVDWSNVASPFLTIPGRAHCFSMLDRRTARLIWGNPRRSEDIDVASGDRRPSRLLPETYRSGCPELSAQKDRLLFATVTPEGASEIKLSTSPDGSDSRSITPGMEPVWFRNGEDFVYSLDPYHAGVFSLSTMSFTLLPDPGLGGRQVVSEKAVSQNTDAVALLFGDIGDGVTVAIYEGSGLSLRKVLRPAAGINLKFDRETEEVLIAYRVSPSTSSLVGLDWQANALRQIGRYPGFDVIDKQPALDKRSVVFARQRRKDAWLYDRTGRHRLSDDGRTFSAASSDSGRVLLGRVGDDGRFAIWRKDPGTAPTRVTSGPGDILPTFAPGGRLWGYVDDNQRSIMVCESTSDVCRVLLKDDQLPSWPRFSPDGRNLAYVTQAGAQRVFIVSLEDGTKKQIGASFSQCPPVWSSPTRLWTFEGSPNRYYWVEREVERGSPTGARIDVTAQNNANQDRDEVNCWPSEREELFLPRVQIESEENGILLRLER